MCRSGIKYCQFSCCGAAGDVRSYMRTACEKLIYGLFGHYDPFERANRRRIPPEIHAGWGALMRHQAIWGRFGRPFAAVEPMLAVALPLAMVGGYKPSRVPRPQRF